MHYFKTLNKNYINIFWNTEKKVFKCIGLVLPGAKIYWVAVAIKTA